jgi:hypothetical protein
MRCLDLTTATFCIDVPLDDVQVERGAGYHSACRLWAPKSVRRAVREHDRARLDNAGLRPTARFTADGAFRPRSLTSTATAASTLLPPRAPE